RPLIASAGTDLRHRPCRLVAVKTQPQTRQPRGIGAIPPDNADTNRPSAQRSSLGRDLRPGSYHRNEDILYAGVRRPKTEAYALAVACDQSLPEPVLRS